MRKNPLDRGVIERHGEGFAHEAFSIIPTLFMTVPSPVRPPSDTELLSTVLDLEELLAKTPQLIARLTRFNAFSVYLLDEARHELRIAYAVGYPEGALESQRLRVGQGVVGAAVDEGRPILVNDIRREPRYVGPLAAASVRGARGGRDRERAAVQGRAAVRGHAGNARRDRS
jgi:GAF domain-containing protein